jgi:hypothetical protein
VTVAGFYFGTSRWDDIPATLGLHVEGGRLTGPWNGMSVGASFANEYDHQRDTYYHYTWVEAAFDPPLLLGAGEVRGLDPEHRRRVLDEAVLGQLQANVVGPTRLGHYALSDWNVRGRWDGYEGSPQRYGIAFDALTHAAKVIAARRAADPARWEGAVQASWPDVARAWGLSVDPRRYRFWGKVHGRDVLACPTIAPDPLGSKASVLTTQVQVQLGLPAGAALSLSRQNGDGFFRRLFRGQDVILGDEAFDAAFVVKGEPESFVRAALGPSVRAHLNSLRASGYEVTLHEGVLDVFAPGFTSKGAEFDELLKRAFAAATALGVG